LTENGAVNPLRPASFAEFVGNEHARERVERAVKFCRERGEPLPHALFEGPPGMGKTSLAMVAAAAYGTKCWTYSAASLEDATDLAEWITGEQPNDILFLDEIHALPQRLAENLYRVMDDHYLDAPRKRFIFHGVETNLNSGWVYPMTLIGATTASGKLPKPLRDRLGFVVRLRPYTTEQLARIVTQAAGKLGAAITDMAASAIAQRGKETPRLALALLSESRLWANGTVDLEAVGEACKRREIDERGLDALDREYLAALAGSRIPLGLTSLCGRLSEEPKTVEWVIEPFLLRSGFATKTPRGRVLTPAGREVVG